MNEIEKKDEKKSEEEKVSIPLSSREQFVVEQALLAIMRKVSGSTDEEVKN